MRKLLIADDEPGIRSLVRMTLEMDSCEILEAGNGHEALDVARAEHPDLVFLDVMMPGPSGIEVCRALKADPETKDITVILLTAKAQDRDREEGLAAGADGYFTKPFSPVALMSKVDEVLGDDQ